MNLYIVSPKARDDIFEIWSYIETRENSETADRIEDEIFSTFEKLARTPGQGHRRSDLTSYPVLFFSVYSYMIVYSNNSPIEILGVIHGKRNVRRLLKERLF